MKNQLVEIIEKYDMNGFKGRYDSSGRHLGGWGTDKNDWHGYCDYYVEELTKFKERDVSLLELGTNYGCSAILVESFCVRCPIAMMCVG